MNGAQLLLKCLEAEGVEYIFGIPGEENLHIMDALLDSPIRFVTCRHEQGAAFMADVYGRLTGRAGVCLATLGPGATNLITGVADADMDNAPLVAIAGQASTTRLHKESHQVLDLEQMFQPISKYSCRILSPATIPEMVRKAFKLAQTEKPGASFIEFPENIAKLEVDEFPLDVRTPIPAEPSAGRLASAAEVIANAKWPIILAGNGAVRAGASAELAALAETLNIPVAHTFMAKGVIPFSHPLCLGSVGLQASDHVSCGFSRADVIICVGYDLVEYHPHLWHPGRDRVIIHIDQTPSEVDRHYGVGVCVVGDIKSSLRALRLQIPPRSGNLLRPLRDALVADMEQHADDTGFPVKPQKLIHDLRAALRDDDIVICDVGAHKMWMARMFPCERPNTCIISNGFASMGIAVPGAVAAKLTHPEQRVVAVTGDGGFLMNSQEVETAMRLGLALVILIWTDASYGLIEWKQMNGFGRPSQVHFNNPDFVRYAESFGAKGYRIERGEDLLPTLRQALIDDTVVIIDCPVDYRENLRLTQQLGEMVCPV
ncbi:MAG: acetolactate synthase large subunit [Desulfobulbaceae bacterium]|nr:acetolactate synthase large subunit [Desulfobulbaceae bacterium]